MPFVESLLPERLLTPVPSFKGDEWDKLLRQKQHVGGIELDCVVLQRAMTDLIEAPMGLFPAYCFSQGKPVLRWSGSYGQYSALYNQMATFRGKNIAEELTITEQPDLPILTAHVETLAGLASVNDADFQPPSGATVAPHEPVELSPQDEYGHIVKKVPPIYPEAAKQSHIEGKVILQVTIGEDGRVHQMTVLSAPHPLLAIASMMAVKQWEYKPYLLNGHLVSLQTQMTVDFRLR